MVLVRYWSDNTLLNEEDVLKIQTDSSEPDFLKAVEIKNPNEKNITNLSLDDLGRLAVVYPWVTEKTGVHPLPLKWGPKKEPYKLMPHQIEAIKWMTHREELSPEGTHGIQGGILALTMGMGKTLTVLTKILTSKKGKYPSLVVCSKTVMYEWKIEGVNKFFGDSIKVIYLHKDFMDGSFDKISLKDIMKADVVITTYDVCTSVCRKEKYNDDTFDYGKSTIVHLRSNSKVNPKKAVGANALYNVVWERVICDESQRFVNYKSFTYSCIMALCGRYKWCVSGSPIVNYETDIWAQLRFCGYNGVMSGNDWSKIGKETYVHQELDQAVFCMKYEDAGISLPPKIMKTHSLELTGKQLEIYNSVLTLTRRKYGEMMRGQGNYACVLALFTRLRQCSIAGCLMMEAGNDNMESIKNLPEETIKWCSSNRYGEAGIESTKITQTLNILRNIKKGSKVLVFSSFSSALSLLGEAVDKRFSSFKYLQIDGSIKGKAREEMLKKFKTSPNISALFLTYKVGSEGLNLTVATECIHLDAWWAPSVEDQADARCWRNGQTKSVNVHEIVVQNTIEPRVISIRNSKREMSASYTNTLNKKMLGKIIGMH